MRRSIASAFMLAAAAAIAPAAIAVPITSQAYTQADILDGGLETWGGFSITTTALAPAINGVTTTVDTGLPGGSAPSVMTLRVVTSETTFTYDLTVTAFTSEQGVETEVNKRLNTGRVMPDSTLTGEHRQRIDSPTTVGAGNWEFLRLSVGNIQIISGADVSLLGFNSVRIDAIATGSNGNIEDLSDNGAVIAAWVGDDDNKSQIIDLTGNYTDAIDLVGTSNHDNINSNRPAGFAIDFEVGTSPGVLGDFDGDGDVDGVDIAEMFSNFNGPGGGAPTNPETDMDNDGDVDGVDIATLFGAFTGPLAPASVPEPTSLALLSMLALSWTVRRGPSRSLLNRGDLLACRRRM